VVLLPEAARIPDSPPARLAKIPTCRLIWAHRRRSTVHMPAPMVAFTTVAATLPPTDGDSPLGVEPAECANLS
jgi:hypothetical protein